MHFEEGQIFFLFWFIGALVLFFVWAWQRRQSMMKRFVEDQLLKSIAPGLDKRKMKIKIGLLISVFIFSILALMRPQWGFEWREVKREGLDILIAIDVSKSMLTKDIQPNRLERAKLAVKDLLGRLKGDRVGLVAFAGSAYLTCPFTIDYNGFLLALDDLNTATIPRGGTDIGSAIREGLKSYEKVPSQYKALIIITDGDNLEGDPLFLAQEAKKKNIKIFCVGMGTKEGDLIRLPNESGGEDFVKDKEGHYVKSRLNEELLQKIALTTDGIYIRLSGAQSGLDYIYDNRLSKMDKREFKNDMEKKFFDRFQIPLGLAFSLLLLETLLGFRYR